MKTIYLFFIVLWALILLPTTVFSQEPITVGIVKDDSVAENELFNSQMKMEIESLLKARTKVTFLEATVLWDSLKAKDNIQSFLDNPEIDLIVTVGILSSEVASEFTYYSKPVIAATILKDKFQKEPLQIDGRSGVSNFSYTEPWLDIEKDLAAFSKMFDFHELAVVLPQSLLDNFRDILPFIKKEMSDKSVIFSVLREDKTEDAMMGLEEKFHTLRGGKGIAFTIPMTGVIGVAIYRFLSNNRK